VSCNDIGDCHEEIAVAMTLVIATRRLSWQTWISSTGDQFEAFICKEKGCFWKPPNKNNDDSRSHRPWSQRGNQGLGVMNLQSMSYQTMRLPIFFQQFRCVLDGFRSVGSCGMSNILGLVIGSDVRGKPLGKKTIEESR
jgi:hypothetical protein